MLMYHNCLVHSKCVESKITKETFAKYKINFFTLKNITLVGKGDMEKYRFGNLHYRFMKLKE